MPLLSKWSLWSARGAWRVLMLLALLAQPALAQVPQNTNITRRLVDGAGNPIGGRSRSFCGSLACRRGSPALLG